MLTAQPAELALAKKGKAREGIMVPLLLKIMIVVLTKVIAVHGRML